MIFSPNLTGNGREESWVYGANNSRIQLRLLDSSLGNAVQISTHVLQ